MMHMINTKAATPDETKDMLNASPRSLKSILMALSNSISEEITNLDGGVDTMVLRALCTTVVFLIIQMIGLARPPWATHTN